jgi:hypothetical protein
MDYIQKMMVIVSSRRRRGSIGRLVQQVHRRVKPRIYVLDHPATITLHRHPVDGVKLCMQNSSNLSGSASKSN